MASFYGFTNSVGSPKTNKGWCYDTSLMYEIKILPNRCLTIPLFCSHALSLECEIGTAVEPFREKNNNVKPACHKIYLLFAYFLFFLLNIYYTPRKLCLWGGILFSRCPSVRLSVRPSVMFWFFFNILKRQWWKFIKFCRHIDIDKMYVYNRKLRARGQFCWSYCPL